MPLNFNRQETEECIHSLKKYFTSELDQDLGDLKAKLLLDYIAAEIAPFAYNHGVKDAEEYFRQKIEDLPATCFEPALTWWQKKRR